VIDALGEGAVEVRSAEGFPPGYRAGSGASSSSTFWRAPGSRWRRCTEASDKRPYDAKKETVVVAR